MRLKLRPETHAVFRREGTHLSMDLRISLRQALLGFSRRIRHLDGHEVVIANAGISTPGMQIVLPGEGMPVRGGATKRWGWGRAMDMLASLQRVWKRGRRAGLVGLAGR